MYSELKNQLNISSILILSKDTIGNEFVRDIDTVQVRKIIQCMGGAVKGIYDFIVVKFEGFSGRSRNEVVELCRLLKNSIATHTIPILVILYPIDYRTLEELNHAGIDYVMTQEHDGKYNTINKLIQTISELGTTETPQVQLETVCPFIHSSGSNEEENSSSCGAYNDILILGKPKINNLCSTLKHKSCQFFKAPKSKGEKNAN